MYELIYHSIANKNLVADDITAILKIARDFNSKNNITGCLLYHNQEFIQLLEGDREIIKALYASILKDNRHSNVLLLAEGEITDRTFDKWSMAYHELGDDDIKSINKLLFVKNFKSLSELADKPTHATGIFWYMAQQLLEDV